MVTDISPIEIILGPYLLESLPSSSPSRSPEEVHHVRQNERLGKEPSQPMDAAGLCLWDGRSLGRCCLQQKYKNIPTKQFLGVWSNIKSGCFTLVDGFVDCTSLKLGGYIR